MAKTQQILIFVSLVVDGSAAHIQQRIMLERMLANGIDESGVRVAELSSDTPALFIRKNKQQNNLKMEAQVDASSNIEISAIAGDELAFRLASRRQTPETTGSQRLRERMDDAAIRPWALPHDLEMSKAASVHNVSFALSEFGYGDLHVVIPSYSGHLDAWAAFMSTIITNTDNRSTCNFAKVTYTTVLSNPGKETTAFKKKIDDIFQQRCPDTCATVKRADFLFTSVDDVVAKVRGGNRIELSEVTNRNWLQSIKKFYGCLAAADVSVHGKPPHRKHACFAIDSDSVLKKNSICHTASRYLEKKSVIISPCPDSGHQCKQLNNSRMLLGMSVGDRRFGEFWAMESYHWVFEPLIVQSFLRDHDFIARMQEFPDDTPFAEEAYYHYLYPLRHYYGYKYIDGYAVVKQLVGETQWNLIQNDTEVEGGTLEFLCRHGFASTEQLQVQQIIHADSDWGISIWRGDCGAFNQYIDLCVAAC